MNELAMERMVAKEARPGGDHHHDAHVSVDQYQSESVTAYQSNPSPMALGNIKK
jgi:hypothetical protein